MIVRAIDLRNSITTGTTCSSAGRGDQDATIKVADLGGRACDVVLYAGLQLLSSAANGIKIFLQANSSSGYTTLNPTGADLVAFTSRACRDSQWAQVTWNCASATSTNRRFYRAAWQQTCAQTNNWLLAMSLGE